ILYLTKILMPLLDIKYKYILICYILFSEVLSIICILVWLYIGSWYNKNYTMRLIKKGYSPLENDDYALALLKGYGYLEYTEEEKADSEKMELYKNTVETVKKR
ncbi:transcriptional regulator, partial [Fusobacterium animalis ATCC 51191]